MLQRRSLEADVINVGDNLFWAAHSRRLRNSCWRPDIVRSYADTKAEFSSINFGAGFAPHAVQV